MLSKILISVAAFAVGVYAQNSSAAAPLPTSIGQVDACILNCTTTAAVSAGCVSVANFSCVCTSSDFQSAANQCLMSQCTKADLQTALQLDQAECASFTSPSSNSTTTGNSTSKPTTTAPGSSATNGTTPPATSSTSAGVAQQLSLSVSHIVGLAGALAGVMTGFGLLL